MSEPFYLSGDPASWSNSYEGAQDLECDECGYEAEIPTSEEVGHGEVTWYAEWTCFKCGADNSKEGWYDPNFND